MERKIIDISTSTIIRVFAIFLLLWVLYLVREVVVLFFLSVILTATLDPLISWMTKKKISRSLAVFIIYLILFLGVAIIFSFLIPPLVGQFKDFVKNLPAYNEAFAKSFSGFEQHALSYGINFNSHELLQNLSGNLFQSSAQFFGATVSVVTFFISTLVVLALTFYMSVKEDGMNKFLLSITPEAHGQYVISVANRIKSKIGKWLAGQLILMVIIFILDFIALSIFNIPYALVLALLAGLLEIVPYLGPIISATLASLLGLLISPFTGLVVLAVLTVIQQIESHIIVPQIMRKAVGLNPVVVILSLLIGAKLGGTMGAILAIPIATSIGVVVGDLVEKN